MRCGSGGGRPFGHHRLSFRRDGDRLTVDIEIALEVRIAFVTAYRYRHRNTEIWRDGRLVSLDSRTDDDGRQHRVTARSAPEGLVVDGIDGRIVAPADIIPTSYWNKAIVDQTTVLDTQHGRLVDVTIRPRGTETVTAAGQSITTERYAVTGGADLDLWYSQAGQWVRMAFTARGSDIEYVLDRGTGPGASATLVAAAR